MKPFHNSHLKIPKSEVLTNRGPTRQTAVLWLVYVITSPGRTVRFYAMGYILGKSSLGWQHFLMRYLPRFESGLCQFHLLWPFLHRQLSSDSNAQAARSTTLSDQHWEAAYQQLSSSHLLQILSGIWPILMFHQSPECQEWTCNKQDCILCLVRPGQMQGRKRDLHKLVFWKRVGKYHYSCESLTEIQWCPGSLRLAAASRLVLEDV